MALDKILKIYDGDGNEVDYDILANDVKFQDGVDLPSKIAEMEEDISEAGTGNYTKPADGIPATDLDASVNESLDKADTAFQKPASGIPSTDMSQAVQDALAAAGTAYQKPASGIPPTDLDQDVYDALAQAETALQPNDMATINNQPLTEGGNISIPTGDDGVTPHIGANGNWWIGPETDPANDTGDPARGPQGAQGNVQVDGDGNVLIVNNLTDGGAGAALSAEMGLLIKREVNRLYTSLSRLYGKLANMAFWNAQDQEDAEPTPLNWNVPQVTLAFDLTGVGSGVSVKLNDETVTGNVSVDKGSTATLTIEAKDDWVLNNDIAVEVDGVSQQLTTIGNIYSLDIVANANAAVEVVGTADRDWITANKDDVTEGGTVVQYGMQLGRSIHADYGTTVGGISGSTPNGILYPAGEPLNTRIFTSDPGPNTPGTSAAYFLDARNSAGTAGKRYMRVKVEDADIGSDVYRIIVALYSQTGGAYVNSTTEINGWVVRPDYQSITIDQAVFDLNTLATGKGLSAGAIKYAKLLVFRRQGGATGPNVDPRTWYEDVSIKYCFTDD